MLDKPPLTEAELKILLSDIYNYLCYVDAGVPSTDPAQVERFNIFFRSFSAFYLDGGNFAPLPAYAPKVNLHGDRA